MTADVRNDVQQELPIVGSPVKGYTDQSKERVALVNHNKKLEELCLRRIDELRAQGGHDPRWLAMAKTDMERAFMCLNRAVFQPERVEGELDL